MSGVGDTRRSIRGAFSFSSITRLVGEWVRRTVFAVTSSVASRRVVECPVERMNNLAVFVIAWAQFLDRPRLRPYRESGTGWGRLRGNWYGDRLKAGYQRWKSSASWSLRIRVRICSSR